MRGSAPPWESRRVPLHGHDDVPDLVRRGVRSGGCAGQTGTWAAMAVERVLAVDRLGSGAVGAARAAAGSCVAASR
jgi:hypothetical protein